MTNNLTLAKCPYCESNSGIIVADPEQFAGTKTMVGLGAPLDLTKPPDQQLITFCHDHPNTPCEHLVLLVGNLILFPDDRGQIGDRLDFSWEHPLCHRHEGKPVDYMWRVYDHLTYGEAEVVQPEVPFHWPNLETKPLPLDTGDELCADGYALFAAQPEQLFVEAAELARCEKSRPWQA